MIRILGLFVFCIGCYCLVLHSLFRVRVHQFGMSCFLIGTAMSLLPLAMGGTL